MKNLILLMILSLTFVTSVTYAGMDHNTDHIEVMEMDLSFDYDMVSLDAVDGIMATPQFDRADEQLNEVDMTSQDMNAITSQYELVRIRPPSTKDHLNVYRRSQTSKYLHNLERPPVLRSWSFMKMTRYHSRK